MFAVPRNQTSPRHLLVGGQSNLGSLPEVSPCLPSLQPLSWFRLPCVSVLSDQPGRVDRPPCGAGALKQPSAITGCTSDMLWQCQLFWHLHCDGDSELSTGTAVRKCQRRIYGVQQWLCNPHLEKQMPMKSNESVWQERGGTYLQWNRKHPASSQKHQIVNGSNYLQGKKCQTF